MPNIEIYTTLVCPFYLRAKVLLRAKSLDFCEIHVMVRSSQHREMRELAGSRWVPQNFFDGKHFGDCNRLYAVDAEGKLDARIGLDG